MNDWMKRELDYTDEEQGAIDMFVSNTLINRSLKLVASGQLQKFKIDSDGLDVEFSK